jgi:hypothetical protein
VNIYDYVDEYYNGLVLHVKRFLVRSAEITGQPNLPGPQTMDTIKANAGTFA